MSNPSEPKGPTGPPAEGPTKAFVVKIDGWLTDLMKKDLELDADPPAGEPDASAIPPEGAPPEAPPAPAPAPAPRKR